MPNEHSLHALMHIIMRARSTVHAKPTTIRAWLVLEIIVKITEVAAAFQNLFFVPRLTTTSIRSMQRNKFDQRHSQTSTNQLCCHALLLSASRAMRCSFLCLHLFFVSLVTGSLCPYYTQRQLSHSQFQNSIAHQSYMIFHGTIAV